MEAQVKPSIAIACDTLWYKDAIIYQLHVKSFYDGNNDGIGDLPGLISKLDYIAELGVNILSLAAIGRWIRYQRLSQRSSRLRDARRLSSLRSASPRARNSRHY
jgi:pullulanase/glycogen debranching enzyme